LPVIPLKTANPCLPGPAAQNGNYSRPLQSFLSDFTILRVFTNEQMMSESRELLNEYASSRSEPAFRELVERYVNLVHSVALRLAGGDTHLAEDVTQIVFADLAAMAPKLPERVLLGGWLHQHTCFVTKRTLRTERRRRIRERQAAEMNAQQDHTEANLARIAPILDEGIGRLGTSDRTAIILHYFEQYDLRSVGEALGTTEDAAQKRLSRALEKLHALLKHRGATLSAAALGTALATEAVTAAPAGLAGSVVGAALASVAARTGFSAALYKLAAMTKVQAGAIGAIVLLGVAASVVVEHKTRAAQRVEDELLRQQWAELVRQQAENGRLAGLVQAGGSRANTLEDLVRLRSEASSLRSQTNGLAASLEENRRLHALNAEEEGTRQLTQQLFARQWVDAFRKFAAQNGGQFPNTFDEARPFLRKGASAATNSMNGKFEIFYGGTLVSATNGTRVVVLREKQPYLDHSGNWMRFYCFADGESTVDWESSGNFDSWEKAHIFLAPPKR
jgi:RNA polymerase sigma factor (sigma-70 family)